MSDAIEERIDRARQTVIDHARALLGHLVDGQSDVSTATEELAEALQELDDAEEERDDADEEPNDCPECARSFGPHYQGPCDHG